MKNLTVYHSTTPENANQILKEGFKLGAFGRFGEGVCFFEHLLEAQTYRSGKSQVIAATIASDQLLRLDYLRLSTLHPELDLSWEEEEGWPGLKEWVLNQGYSAVSIRYTDETCEVVVYNSALIQSISLV